MNVRVPNMQHAEQRWIYMRALAVKNIKAQGASK